MISASRFIASKQLDAESWLEARRWGVTATAAAKAMTPSGYKEIVTNWGNETPITVNAYMQFGLDSEGWLALWAKEHLEGELMPNEWLIRHETNPIAYATPDGIGLDHNVILEIKTTGKDWGTVEKVPVQYYRQIQWQLYVTDAVECALVWLLREQVDTPDGPIMVPGWLEPKYGYILRDDELIAEMAATADKLWLETGGK